MGSILRDELIWLSIESEIRACALAFQSSQIVSLAGVDTTVLVDVHRHSWTDVVRLHWALKVLNCSTMTHIHTNKRSQTCLLDVHRH